MTTAVPRATVLVIIIGSMILLFARLGHYALWDDEAITAMTARAVWQTGDTSARVDDHNVLAYRNGLLIRGFKDRFTPPLQFYLIAPFLGLLGDSNFACRLPMALCGVVTVAILLIWLARARAPALVCWAAAVLLLTNASFFLFFRQCRYYGLGMMLTSAVAYFYCNRENAASIVTRASSPWRRHSTSKFTSPLNGAHRIAEKSSMGVPPIATGETPVPLFDHGPSLLESCAKEPHLAGTAPQARAGGPCHDEMTAEIAALEESPESRMRPTQASPSSTGAFWSNVFLAVSLSALLAAHYLDYAAVVACLVVDYLLWGFRVPIRLRGWLIILLPQVIVGVFVLSIWNPLAQSTDTYHPVSWISDRLHLLYYNWRDMIACDFVSLPLLMICPLLYFKSRSTWLLRAPMAVFVFVCSIGVLVPTSLAQAKAAEVRYLAPVVPICIAASIVAVAGTRWLAPRMRWTLLSFAAVPVFVQIGHPPADPDAIVLQSTPFLYYHELITPQVESYTPVIDWINANVPSGASIYVQPSFKAYPLMFRAGKAVYGWQVCGERITFAPASPAPGEMPTLTAYDDETGKPAVTIQVTNPPDAVVKSVSAAMIDAWNTNPTAASLAMASGDGVVTLTAVRTGEHLQVKSSVEHAGTGKLTQKAVTPQRAEFNGLPDIQFVGRTAPDYIIRFGTNGESAEFRDAMNLLTTRGISYTLIKTIHQHWRDAYRPELIWRSFVTVPPKPGDEIRIYQRDGRTPESE
jgi:hypothetical protein